jgi:hypothetical protein
VSGPQQDDKNQKRKRSAHGTVSFRYPQYQSHIEEVAQQAQKAQNN